MLPSQHNTSPWHLYFKFQNLLFSGHTFRSIIIIVRVYFSNIWYDNNVCRVNMQCRWLDITNSWLSGCFPKNMTTMYILSIILNKSNIQTIRDPVLLLWPVFWWYIWVLFLWDIGKNGQHVAHNIGFKLSWHIILISRGPFLKKVQHFPISVKIIFLVLGGRGLVM